MRAASPAPFAYWSAPNGRPSSPQRIGFSTRPYGGLRKKRQVQALECNLKGRGELMGITSRLHAASVSHGEVLRCALLCIGYGSYQACCYNGVVYKAFLVATGLPPSDAWACIILLVAGSGVGCLAVRALHERGVHLAGRAGAGAGYTAMALIGMLALAMRASPSALLLLAGAMGLATSPALLLWFKAFLALYRRHGPVECMLAITCGTMAGFSPVCLTGFASGPEAWLALQLAGMGCAAAVQLGIATGGRVSDTAGEQAAGMSSTRGSGQVPTGASSPYRLSIYVAALVASFGATTGFAGSMGFFFAGGGARDTWLILASACAACTLLIVLSLVTNKGATLHFGLLIRIALVVAGVVFGFAPALLGFLPQGLTALCQVVTVVQGVAMTLLSVEICYERNLAMSDVMPANYAIYVVCVCAGMCLASLASSAGSDLAWQLVAALATASVVIVIPALPASSSTAATFTAKTLLENERYDQRSARVCQATASRFGLTPREADVLGLLLQGRTRAQIAEALSLSVWTVKEYVGSVYAKVGVHSAKDLMVQCMAQAGSPKEG